MQVSHDEAPRKDAKAAAPAMRPKVLRKISTPSSGLFFMSGHTARSSASSRRPPLASRCVNRSFSGLRAISGCCVRNCPSCGFSGSRTPDRRQRGVLGHHGSQRGFWPQLHQFVPAWRLVPGRSWARPPPVRLSRSFRLRVDRDRPRPRNQHNRRRNGTKTTQNPVSLLHCSLPSLSNVLKEASRASCAHTTNQGCDRLTVPPNFCEPGDDSFMMARSGASILVRFQKARNQPGQGASHAGSRSFWKCGVASSFHGSILGSLFYGAALFLPACRES